MSVRNGEAPYHDYTRCNRLIDFNGQWSFTTREKTIEGPYPSREDAESALQQFIIARQAAAPLKTNEIPTLQRFG